MNYGLSSAQSGILIWYWTCTKRSLMYSFLGVRMTCTRRPTQTDTGLTLNTCKLKTNNLVLLDQFDTSAHHHPLFWPKQPSFKTRDCKFSGDTGTPGLWSLALISLWYSRDGRAEGINTWLVTGNGKLWSFSCYWFRIASASSSSCILAGSLWSCLPWLSPCWMTIPPAQPASTAVLQVSRVLWKDMDGECQVSATGLETSFLLAKIQLLTWAV